MSYHYKRLCSRLGKRSLPQFTLPLAEPPKSCVSKLCGAKLSWGAVTCEQSLVNTAWRSLPALPTPCQLVLVGIRLGHLRVLWKQLPHSLMYWYNSSKHCPTLLPLGWGRKARMNTISQAMQLCGIGLLTRFTIARTSLSFSWHRSFLTHISSCWRRCLSAGIFRVDFTLGNR